MGSFVVRPCWVSRGPPGAWKSWGPSLCSAKPEVICTVKVTKVSTLKRQALLQSEPEVLWKLQRVPFQDVQVDFWVVRAESWHGFTAMFSAEVEKSHARILKTLCPRIWLPCSTSAAAFLMTSRWCKYLLWSLSQRVFGWWHWTGGHVIVLCDQKSSAVPRSSFSSSSGTLKAEHRRDLDLQVH